MPNQDFEKAYNAMIFDRFHLSKAATLLLVNY